MKGRLEIVGLAITILAGLFGLINQFGGMLASFDYAPEVLLGLFILGLLIWASFLTWSTASLGSRTVYRHSGRIRLVGAAVFLFSLVSGFVIWRFTIRIPPEVQGHIRSGDIAAQEDEDWEFALDQYGQALKAAPWNVKIKNKIKLAEGKRAAVHRGTKEPGD